MTQAVFHQRSSQPVFQGEVPTASLTFGVLPLPTPQARRYSRRKALAPARSAWDPLWVSQSPGGSQEPGATDPNPSVRAAARRFQKRNRAASCPDGSYGTKPAPRATRGPCGRAAAPPALSAGRGGSGGAWGGSAYRDAGSGAGSRAALTCQQLLQALAEGLQLPLVHQPLGPQELGDEAHGRGDLAYHAGPGVQGGMHGGGGRRGRSVGTGRVGSGRDGLGLGSNWARRGRRRPAHMAGAAASASSSSCGTAAAAAAAAALPASPAARGEGSRPPRAASYSRPRQEVASGHRGRVAANGAIAPL